MGADQMVIDELEDLVREVKKFAGAQEPALQRSGPKLRDVLSDPRPTWLIAARHGLDHESLETQLAKALEIERRIIARKNEVLSGSDKFAEQLRLGEQVKRDLQDGFTWGEIESFTGKQRRFLKQYADRYADVIDTMCENIARNYDILDKDVKWVPGWDQRRDATYTPEQLGELYGPPYEWSIEKIAAETGWHYRKVREHLRKAGAYARKHGKPVDNL